jgi:hypothetical protein
MTDESTPTDADGASANNQSPPSDDVDGKFYTFLVDGDEYQTEQSSLTAREIMERADIPIDVGLILIHDDGTEEQLEPDDEIEFDGPGRRLKQAPQFKRG